MKATFTIGILAGFAAAIAGAYSYPWVSATRLPSQTTVVANGGRAEQFLIRLPADRVGSRGSVDAGLRGAAYPAGAELPEPLRSAPSLIEEFKLRDRAGGVVGLAVRHWTETEQGPATAWLLVIPGRGALMMTAPGEPRGGVDGSLSAAGYRAPGPWSGDVEFAATAGDGGRVVAGSAEFEGLEGGYSETWKITGVEAGGEVRGTVELDTVLYRSAAGGGNPT